MHHLEYMVGLSTGLFQKAHTAKLGDSEGKSGLDHILFVHVAFVLMSTSPLGGLHRLAKGLKPVCEVDRLACALIHLVQAADVG